MGKLGRQGVFVTLPIVVTIVTECNQITEESNLREKELHGLEV